VSAGTGALLVSLFNVAWGYYAQVGGVEVLEFCLLVVFPARCVSSISQRVYFRKHAFCFLPLVSILESLLSSFVYRLCLGMDVGVCYLFYKSTVQSEVSGFLTGLCLPFTLALPCFHTAPNSMKPCT
jgi:hypothetical protein